MKKTLITLMAIAGLAYSAESTFTTTPDKSSGQVNDNLWHNGVAFVLNSDASRLTSTSTGVENDSFGYYSEVELVSITLSIRSMHGSTGIDLVQVDSNGKVLAISDNSATVVNEDFTWTFTDTMVSTTDTLYFVFTAAENDRIEVGYNLDLSNTYTSSSGTGWSTSRADVLSCGSGTSGVWSYTDATNYNSFAYLGNNYTPSLTMTSDKHVPNMTVVTMIPEPATATLSLLALAGLAARRRRASH